MNDYIRCADWPVPPEPLEPVTAPGTPPILVISTTGDPATPYEAGVAVAERLESGVLVTNEGDGHTVSSATARPASTTSSPPTSSTATSPRTAPPASDRGR